MSKIYARQPHPGAPIELLWNGEVVTVSDSQALFLAHQLIQFLMGNDQAKARAK